MKAFPTKDPSSKLPHWADWSQWLAIEDRGPIDTYAVAIDEGDAALVIGDTSLGSGEYSGFVLFWLSGGTRETTYVVRIRITLADGTIEDASRSIRIEEH